MPLSMNQKISKLWLASLKLLLACEEARQYLPPEQKKEFENSIELFKSTVNKIRRQKEK